MPNPTILVTPVDVSSSDYPAITAGDNRLAFLNVNYFRTNAGNVTTPNAVTIGTVSAIYVAGDTPGAVVNRDANTTWAIPESQIGDLSGLAITVTGGSGGTVTRRLAYVVQDVKQTEFNWAGQTITTGGLSISLGRVADSLSFFVVWGAVNENLTLTNPSRIGSISNVNYGYAADTERTASATSQSKTYIQNGHIINFEPVPSQLITDVNSGAGIEISSTGNTATVTGAESSPLSGSIGGKAITITDWDDEAGVVTFTAPIPVTGESFPDIDANHIFELVGSDWSATLADVPLMPPADSETVTIADPDNDDPHKFGYHVIDALGVTPADGWKFYGLNPRKVSNPAEVAAITWLPNTGYTGANVPMTTDLILWNADDEIIYVLSILIPVDSPIEVIGVLRDYYLLIARPPAPVYSDAVADPEPSINPLGLFYRQIVTPPAPEDV